MEFDHLKDGQSEELTSSELTEALGFRSVSWRRRTGKSGPELFPIRRVADFDDILTRERVDPLARALSALQTTVPIPNTRVDLTVMPIGSLHGQRRTTPSLLRLQIDCRIYWTYDESLIPVDRRNLF